MQNLFLFARLKVASVFIFALLTIRLCAAVPGIITYQGRLNVSGTTYSGTGYFKFVFVDVTGTQTYWSHDDSSVAGSEPVSAISLTVTNGLFTANIGDTTVSNMTESISSSVFNNSAVYLKLWVSTNGTTFQALSPTTRITANGYALVAARAESVADGSITGASLASNINLNSTGTIAAGSFSGNGSSLTNIGTSSLSSALLASTFWRLNGNSGTTPGTHFIGTTDDQALEFKVNSQRGLRLEPSPYAVNVIGGWKSNSISAGSTGATIAGGGDGENGPNTIGTGAGYATISGGTANTNKGVGAVLGGGVGNTVSGAVAVVNGGNENWGSGAVATIGGGYRNTNTATAGFIGGGEHNLAYGPYSTIVGGSYNTAYASATNATIGGGTLNWVMGNYTTVAGGYGNIGQSNYSAIAGGYGNVSTGDFSSVGGGYGNVSSGRYSHVGNGYGNVANGNYGVVGGGYANIAHTTNSTVGGGFGNIAGGISSTVPGGENNYATGNYSFAAGNNASAAHTGAFVWADSQNAEFSSSASNQFLIRASGGVGIGTDSPATALHVVGTATATIFSGSGSGLTGVSDAYNSSVSLSGTTLSVVDNGGTKSANLSSLQNISKLVASNSTSTAISVDSTGKMGVGTTTPVQLLELATSAASVDAAETFSTFVTNSATKAGTSFVNITNGTNGISWSSPGNVASSDNSYATVNSINGFTGSDFLQVSNFSFSIPTNATIIGIKVTVEAHDTFGSQLYASLSSGSSKSQILLSSPTDSNYVYGSDSDLWSGTWTPSSINTNFYVRLQVIYPTPNTQVDYLQATVYYKTTSRFTLGADADTSQFQLSFGTNLSSPIFTVSSNGAVTATSFSGDGSGLTNVTNGYNTAFSLSGTTLSLTDAGGTKAADLSTLQNIYKLVKSNTTTAALTVDGSGNVGINTNAPAALLDVNGNTVVRGGLAIDASGSNASSISAGTSLIFGGTSSGEGIASRRTAGGNQYGLDFYTSSTLRMAIKLNGFVGIGTTNPTAALTVTNSNAALLQLNGSATSGSWLNLSNSTGRQWNFVSTGSGSAEGAGRLLIRDENNGVRMQFDTNGNVALGYMGATSLTNKLDVNGTIRCSTLYETSDRNMKKDIAPLGETLSKIMALKPSTYRLKDEVESESVHTGFIAQDVENVFPDAVQKAGDHLALNYKDLSVAGIKALQELKREHDAETRRLEEQNSSLQERVAALEKIISHLVDQKGSIQK